MVHLITFSTGLFDVSKEEPNPINPIAGQALLKWVRDKLQASGYTVTEPDTEDWGWYIEVEGHGSSYLVGASGEPEPPSSDVDWTIQIHKHRSLKDKMTGRNQMTAEDPLPALIEGFLRSEPGFRDIEIEEGA